MIRILLPLLCAALGLAAASCNQSEAPFASAAASGSPPAAHDGAAAAIAAPPPDNLAQTASQAPSDASSEPATQSTSQPPSGTQSPAAAGAADAAATSADLRASTLIGMPVESAERSMLGVVKDIIFDAGGRATHLIVAYGGEGDGKLAAIPWETAVAHIKDGRLVLDGAKLQSAPSFTPDTWPDLRDPSWSATADAYWRQGAGAGAAARSSAPIDSTARLRERPSRDGDD